ncbi:MAG: nuclear transport factor 2 family protein [Bacteroidales bacterium]|nr:nuclear transport factor 2 family protein [Bacteroidales bacterium]
MSEREGMQRAFLDFAADSAVILRDNCFPQVGINAMKEYFAVRSDTSYTLIWEPLYEKISADGTLGYTYGHYTLTLKANGEKSRGTYLTVWEKQKDGRWKYVLDSGNQGLPETDLQ